MKKWLVAFLVSLGLGLGGCAAGVLTPSNQGQAWVVRQGFFNTYLMHCIAVGGQARCSRVKD